MLAVGAVGLSAQLASHGKSVVAGTEFPTSGDDLSSVEKYPLSEERPDAGYRTFSAYEPYAPDTGGGTSFSEPDVG